MNDTAFFDGLLAESYDALYGGRDVDAEIKLVLERTRSWLGGSKLSVLDVGCGTGLHMQALLKQRQDVVGMDISPALVAIAQRNLPDERIEVGDLRTFALGQQFDLVLALFGVFDYLWQIEGIRASLRSVAMHTRRGGILYLVVSRASTMAPEEQDRRITLDDGRVLQRWTTPSAYDPDGISVKLRYDFKLTELDGSFTEHYELHIMRAWTKTELQLLLDEAGFRIENTWVDGPTMHVMARRTG